MNPALLQALDAARFGVAKDAVHPLWWRVQRVTTDLLAKSGIAQLRLVLAAQADVKVEEGESAEETGAKALVQAADSDVDRLTKAKNAVIAAGLVGIGESEEGPWSPITIVEEKRRDLAKGHLTLADIPGSSVQAIMDAIEKLDDPQGEAARRLATFLGRS